jgi:hypothetical protein
MGKCTQCGQKARLLMAMCDGCIRRDNEATVERQREVAVARAAPYADLKCAGCGGAMESFGKVPLRIGGSTGGFHLLMGAFAGAGERLMTLDLLRCRECRRVEFYDLDLQLGRR